MGFNYNTVKLLVHSKRYGVDFGKVITIGRQAMHLEEKEFSQILRKINIDEKVSVNAFKSNPYCEDFLKLIGANKVDSLDASDYENSSIIFDLNKPLDNNSNYEKYSTVIDGGSLEHIFNFPTAIQNCMKMVDVEGHFIGISPANNFFGHGFYQFSPELFFRIFSENNGFEMIKMFLFGIRNKRNIYEVSDPLAMKERGKIINAEPLYLFVIAKKIKECEAFGIVAQQSDYEHIVWKGRTKTINPSYQFKALIKNLLPNKIRQKLVLFKYKILILTKLLGVKNSKHFIKIEL